MCFPAALRWLRSAPTSRLPVISCVVVEAEASAPASADAGLSKNQKTMLTILIEAGSSGLTTKDWNEKAREIGMGTKRRQDLYDLQVSLKAKRMVRKYGERWFVNHDSKEK